MVVNDTYLSDLTDTQVQFSSAFLEDAFLQQKRQLSGYDAEEVDTIRRLIKSVPSSEMKQAILTSLETDVQVQLAKGMDPGDIKALFSYHDKTDVLKAIFPELDPALQEVLMKQLYEADRGKYKALKPLVGRHMTVIGGIVVKDESVIRKMVNDEVNTVISQMVSGDTNDQQLAQYAKRLEEKFGMEVFETFCIQVIHVFMKQKVPLNSPANFIVHVKFYAFLVPYVILYPEVRKMLRLPLDLFLMHMDRFPSDDWVIKVMGQLPPVIIKMAMKRLRNYKRIPEFKKRTIYSKLWSVCGPHFDRYK